MLVAVYSDIETYRQNCLSCSRVNFKPFLNVTYPWPKPKSPFERVNVDFYVFKNVTLFIYVDAFSKRFYVAPMLVTNAASVIASLLNIFAFWGLSSKIVSDNGPPFNSNEYRDFCTSLDISVAFSPINHPQSNSVAERSVQICKKLLKKLESSHPKASTSDWQTILSKVLFAYLNDPSTTLGKSPKQVLLSFSPRTPLSNLHPMPFRLLFQFFLLKRVTTF